MSVTPPYLRGQDWTSCTITPYALGADGTLTPGAGATITAVVDSFEPRRSVQSEEIRAVNNPRLNNVPVAWGYEGSLRVVASRSTVNALTTIGTGYHYMGISTVMGAETHAAIFSIQGWRGGVNSQGKNTIEIELGAVDIGGPQYTVNGAGI